MKFAAHVCVAVLLLSGTLAGTSQAVTITYTGDSSDYVLDVIGLPSPAPGLGAVLVRARLGTAPHVVGFENVTITANSQHDGQVHQVWEQSGPSTFVQSERVDDWTGTSFTRDNAWAAYDTYMVIPPQVAGHDRTDVPSAPALNETNDGSNPQGLSLIPAVPTALPMIGLGTFETVSGKSIGLLGEHAGSLDLLQIVYKMQPGIQTSANVPLLNISVFGASFNTNFSNIPVPEPSGLALLLIAGLGLVPLWWRRRRAA